MKVIGLTGFARVGKDTVASIIEQELSDLHVKREGFAYRLKVSAALALGFSGTDHELVELMDELKVRGTVTTESEVPYSITGREFLQRYGTEAHRGVFGNAFWIDAHLPLRRRSVGQGGIAAEPARDDCDILVIPDVRFDNEAERIHKYEGEVWRITRPDVMAPNAHASEAGVSDHLIARTIDNLGGVGYLLGAVRYTLREARLS